MQLNWKRAFVVYKHVYTKVQNVRRVYNVAGRVTNNRSSRAAVASSNLWPLCYSILSDVISMQQQWHALVVRMSVPDRNKWMHNTNGKIETATTFHTEAKRLQLRGFIGTDERMN